MDYNELFDLIYSTRLSESMKNAVINRLPVESILEEFTEIHPVTETYLELLDTLVFSTASEALIEDIIDRTFENVDEAIINEVSDEWVKKKVQAGLKNGLKQREKAYKEASSNVIGLSSLDKASKAEDRLNRAKDYAKALNKPSNSSTTPKVGAIDKLKSAVGKVKDWYNKRNATTYDDVRHAIGRTAAENEKKGETDFKNPVEIKAETPRVSKAQTAPQATSQVSKPKTEIKQEVPQATSQVSKPKPKTETKKQKSKVADAIKSQTEAPKAEAQTEAPKAEVKKTKKSKPSKTVESSRTKVKTEVKSEIKQEEPKTEVKEGTPKTKKKISKSKVKPTKVKAETPKAEEVKPTEVKKESEVRNPKLKQEMTDAEKESKKAQQRMERDIAQARKGKEQALKNAQEKYNSMISRPGYSKKEAEDLKNKISELETSLKESCMVDLISLLGNTNISESSFVEIMELFAPNKGNASKVKKKHDNEFNNAIDTLNTEVTNNKVNPETIQKVNNAAERKAKFDEMFRKRFGDS